MKMVWGCEALVKKDTPDKLQQRSVKCIFIGYPKEMMGYYFYFPPENKIVVVRYAEFLEKNLTSQEVSGRVVELKEIQDEDTSPSENTNENSYREVEEHSFGDLNEPTNYRAALLDLKSDKWLDAMNAEIQSIKDNKVWRLVDLPPNCKTVGSKSVFKKKTDMDEIAIIILIAITAFYNYEIWQMDVKTAFLNGYLDEDIYMVQPEGLVDPKHPRKVCKLQRSIYGLKQASTSWNKRFDEEIKRFGFAQNLDEPCVYQKASGTSNEELKEPMEDQPLPADASPTALSSSYVVDSDPEKDEKDPKKDPADYPTNRGDNNDDESSNDDDDVDDVEKDEEEKEEEEHLAPADPSDVSIDDLVPSS
nr:hypothetical protein [Tanacetum cinerariifolium]